MNPPQPNHPKQRILMGLETLNTTNAEGCPACGNKFNLGDAAVLALGAWGAAPRYIHEREAARDPESGQYFERNYFESHIAH